MMSHPLYPKLRQLKLSGILQTLDVRVSQAVDQQLAPLEFLALLLTMNWNGAANNIRY